MSANFSIVLEIHFEKTNYSYVEPEGFDVLEVDNIFMLKNIETELTYTISFQLILAREDATPNIDFQTTVTPFGILDFPPSQQRLQVFGSQHFMEIFPDALPEGEESIHISSWPVDNPPPAYTRPQTGTDTILYILDNDCKKNYIHSLIH